LTITSSSTGEDKWISLGLPMRMSYSINSVTVCYQLSNVSNYITQVRISQQNEPFVAFVRADDPTDLTSTTPVCVTSFVGGVSGDSAFVLELRLNFSDTTNIIFIGGVAVNYTKNPLENGVDRLWISDRWVTSDTGVTITPEYFQQPYTSINSQYAIDQWINLGAYIELGATITGVRVCYKLTNDSYIAQVRLSEMTQASITSVFSDYPTSLLSTNDTCVDTVSIQHTVGGAISVELRLNFGVDLSNIHLGGLGISLQYPYSLPTSAATANTGVTSATNAGIPTTNAGVPTTNVGVTKIGNDTLVGGASLPLLSLVLFGFLLSLV